MLIAVILHGTRVLRDRYRHFVRVRRDLKLAVNNHKLNVREVRVGVLEVASLNAYLILANVRSLGRPRSGRRFLHTGVYVIQPVVSRHALVARNRMLIAVIQHGCRVLRDRYRHFVRDRRDHELTVDRLRNFIFPRPVNIANRVFLKRYRMFADILSRSARFGDIVKGNVFLRAGVARFNRLRFSIISPLGVVRRQRDVLIIVESNLVSFFGNCLFLIRNGRITFNYRWLNL